MCLRYIVTPDGKRLLAGSYENGECYFWKQNTASPFFSSALHTEPGWYTIKDKGGLITILDKQRSLWILLKGKAICVVYLAGQTRVSYYLMLMLSG